MAVARSGCEHSAGTAQYGGWIRTDLLSSRNTRQRQPMFLFVKNVLNATEIEQIRQIARGIRFVDGRQSNPHNLAKKNLQAVPAQPESARAGQIAGAAITRNEEIRNFAFPKRIATPL